MAKYSPRLVMMTFSAVVFSLGIGWLSSEIAAESRRSAICAGTGGDYNDPQWQDEWFECYDEMGGSVRTDAENAISSLNGVCSGEYAYASFMADTYEWTGHNSNGDWGYWNPNNPERIAVHPEHAGSVWLWAHEAAHGLGMGEGEADSRADECLQVYSPKPATTTKPIVN